MNQSRENAQQGFLGNKMSAAQFQQRMNYLQQSPLVPLFNVSGLQNNFYQQINAQAFQELLNNTRNNENSLNFMNPSVLGNNSVVGGSNQQIQYRPPNVYQPMNASMSMNSLLTEQTMSKNGCGSSINYEDKTFKVPVASSTPLKRDHKMKVLFGLQQIALKGCESAARIFQSNSKRPYFKKIDLLCERLKQDLGVTDKAVVNINSHGVAWAIKDFIFVFNRIMSGWTILRDYFYSTSDGMRIINEAFDSNLYEDFMKWQEATEKLSNSLVNTFENLHSVNQHNSNHRKVSKGNGSNNSSSSNISADLPINFQNIFDPSIDEDSEQIQLSGGYFKSAVYKPVSSSEGSMPNTPSSRDFDSKHLLNDAHQESFYSDRSGQSIPLYKRCSNESCEDHLKRNNRSKVNLSEKFEDVNIENENLKGEFFDYLFSCPETL